MDFKQRPLNQSLIGRFLFKGEERVRICPKKIYCVDIIKSHDHTTDSMLKGSYFETLCLGKGAGGKTITDLERKKLTKKQVEINELRTINGDPPLKGEKTMDQLRIEEQAIRFKQLANKYQIVLNEYNVQVPITIPWEKNKDILIRGELDIFPTTMYTKNEGSNEYTLNPAIVDLKLTANLESTFGEWCWGAMEEMDLIQGFTYNYLVRRLPDHVDLNPHVVDLMTKPLINLINHNKINFYYWVFSYKKLDDKIIQVKWDAMKQEEFHQVINKAISVIEYWEELGWPTKPEYSVCKYCPVTECIDRETIQTV